MTPNLKHLFCIATGSHLFGLATPTSDVDLKTIYLPEYDSLLLGTAAPQNIRWGTKESATQISTADTIEVESYPLQKFISDFYSGQVYAIEIAFAAVSGDYPVLNEEATCMVSKMKINPCCTAMFVALCKILIDKHLCLKELGLIDFAQKQSKNYRAKANNVLGFQLMHEVLSKVKEGSPSNGKLMLGDFWNQICEHLGGNVKYSHDPRNIPTIIIGDKVYNGREQVNAAHERTHDILEKFSKRTRAAADKKGLDPKAASHALRIMMEMRNLLRDGKITFPFIGEDLKTLKAIKAGEVPLDDVDAITEKIGDEIAELLEKVDQDHYRYTLHAEEARVVFDKEMVCLLKKFYPH